MLKAKVDDGTLSVAGAAAHAGGLIDIEIYSNGDATVTDDGQVPVDVPISGSTAGIRAIDLSSLGLAGASLTVYGHPASVTGSAQDDHFDLGTSSDTAHAGSGDDYVFGNAGSDRLYGELGDDVLYGGDGDDRFQGSKGNDVIDGGDGDDVALYSGKAGDYRIAIVDGLYQVTDLRTGPHDGVDRVSNVEHLQFSDRTIDLSSASTMLHARVSAGILSVSGEAAVAGPSVGVAIAFDGGVFVTDNSDAAVAVPVSGSGSVHAVDLSDLENTGASLTASTVGALAVTGTAHDDTLYTDAASATIHGGSGDDVNYGGAGSDRLYGELGDDTLYGGGGSDRFQGSKGDDIIDGGVGVDVALYSGKASDYHVSIVDGVYQIVDLRAGVHDGTDIIGNVEHLQFSDKTIDLTESSSVLHAGLASGTLSVSGKAAVDLNQVYV